MAKKKHNDKKLHNSEEELHNSGPDSGTKNVTAGRQKKDIYIWYGPTGKAHSAPRCEDGSVRLEDLILDEDEVYAYRLNEIAKLTVGQFREALAVDKPVLQIDPSQDKIRMSHYVPLHPLVVEALKPRLVGRDDDELMFKHNSFFDVDKATETSRITVCWAFRARRRVSLRSSTVTL